MLHMLLHHVLGGGCGGQALRQDKLLLTAYQGGLAVPASRTSHLPKLILHVFSLDHLLAQSHRCPS
jgi:hypothetical protein